MQAPKTLQLDEPAAGWSSKQVIHRPFTFFYLSTVDVEYLRWVTKVKDTVPSSLATHTATPRTVVQALQLS